MSNLLFAKFINQVTVTWRMVAGCALIVSGTVLSIAFGPSRVLQFTLDDLVGFWQDSVWIVYLVLNLSLAFSAQVCHMIYEKAHRRGVDLKYSSTVLPVTFGLSSALAGSLCVVQVRLARPHACIACVARALRMFAAALGYRSASQPPSHTASLIDMPW